MRDDIASKLASDSLTEIAISEITHALPSLRTIVSDDFLVYDAPLLLTAMHCSTAERLVVFKFCNNLAVFEYDGAYDI